MASEHKPLVSIIIPNYNHALYLQERIESVLNQTFQDFELIILDDCSTDNSKEIITLFESDPKISHIIYNTRNSGSTFKQWNKGVNMAKGKYIWLAESDDSASPDLLATLVNGLESNTSCGIAYCQSNGYDENSNVLGDCLDWTNDLDKDLWRNDFVLEGKEMIQKYLLVKNVIPNASAVIFEKEFYIKSGRGPEEMRFCGDWLVWVRILKLTNIFYSAQQLNYFRFHTCSTRNNESIEKVLNKITEDLIIIKTIQNTFQSESKTLTKAYNKLFLEWVKFLIKEGKVIHFFKLRSVFKKRGLPFSKKFGWFVVYKLF